MKSLLVFVVLVSAAYAGVEEDIWRTKNFLPPAFANDPMLKLKQKGLDQKIIGGSDADIANYPYQVSFRSSGSHICGASIIAPYWVLTAAHCVYPKPAVSSVTFRAGSSNRNSGGQIYQAVQIEYHQNYNPNMLDYDVAVIRVSTAFSGQNIQGIPLVQSGTSADPGTASVVSGWGLTNSGTLPAILQAVTIPVVSQSTCSSQWGSGRITANMVCAGETGRDSCNGDSGGPLVQGGRQFGIVSWGASKCGGPLAGVYTRIASPPIRSFIQQLTGV